MVRSIPMSKRSCSRRSIQTHPAAIRLYRIFMRLSPRISNTYGRDDRGSFAKETYEASILCGRVDAILTRARRLAQEFNPRLLDAGVVLRRLSQREKRLHVFRESRSQRGVSEIVLGKCLVCHRQREHVRKDARAQVLERYA